MHFRTITIAFFVFCLLFSDCKSKVNASLEEPPYETSVAKEHYMESPIERSPFFKAEGLDWSLSISKESMRFTSSFPGFETFNAPTTEPILAADANIKRYISTPEKGRIDIQIAAGETGNKTTYKVRVQIKRGIDSDFTYFEGIGKYIPDYRLHDIWVLEIMEGQAVSKDLFKDERPYLEIDTEQKRFFGFGGCNRINGSIFTEQNLIRFTNIAQTRMLCAPPNKEPDFIKLLKSSTHFKIKNNQLILFNPDLETLRFKKTD